MDIWECMCEKSANKHQKIKYLTIQETEKVVRKTPQPPSHMRGEERGGPQVQAVSQGTSARVSANSNASQTGSGP